MQRAFIIDGDLFARADVAQREEQHMTANGFHVGIRLARVVYVVRAVATAAAV